MKWIGQHIWSFISRFRSDVYLEDLSTTTETNMLIADSNGKVSKRAMSSLTSGAVTVTDSNAGSYQPVVFHDGSNNLLDDTGSFQYYASICNLDLTAAAPIVSITSNTDDANDGHLVFANNKGGNNGDASDSCGTISFSGMDDGTPSITMYGSYEVAIGSPVNTDEYGITRILNRTSDGLGGGTQQALTATGHGTNNTVDIGLGYGAASRTTVAGNLTAYGSEHLFQSGVSNKPQLVLENTNIDNKPADIKFLKDAGDPGADEDYIGSISFYGDNSAQEETSFGQIRNVIETALDTDEAGRMEILTATSQGGSGVSGSALQNVIKGTGHGTNNTVDVNLGYGAASTTTVAGDLVVTSDLTVSGTTTTINTTNLNVEDKNITLNYNNSSDTSGTADGAGITIQDAVDASNDASLTWTAADDTFEFSHAVEINNGASGGTSALIIDNDDVDQIALSIDAANTTANVVDIDALAATTGDILNIRGDALTNGNPIHVVHNDSRATDINRNDNGLIRLDYNKNGNVSAGQTVMQNGINLTMHDVATSNAGAMNMTGVKIEIDSAGTGGIITNTGIDITATDGDINNGVVIQCEDGGGADIKLISSANTLDYFTIVTSEDGKTALTTVDGDASLAHLTLNADGDIVLDPGGNKVVKVSVDDGGSDGTGPGLNIHTGGEALPFFVANAESGNFSSLYLFEEGGATMADYFSIKCESNGETTISTLDAVGADASLTFSIDGYVKFQGNGVEIENGSAAGAHALIIDNNDVDQNALLIEAANTTEHVLDIEAGALTTADAIHVKADALTTGAAINLDINDSLTTSATKSLLKIDYDKSGVTASGQTSMTAGLDINMTDAATNDASSVVRNFGAVITLDAASNQGDIQQTGLGVYLTDADHQASTGIYSKVEDGGVDFKAVSSANVADYFTIRVGAEGATTLTTEDADTAAAHFEIAADGNITLDPAGSIALEANTEITGDLTVSGGDILGPIDSNLNIRTDDSMNFVIDEDNDSTSWFTWYANGSVHGSKALMSLSDTGILQVGSYGSATPQIIIHDQADDANGPELVFNKQRGGLAADAQDGDIVGDIKFNSYDDGTPSTQTYAQIRTTITDATSGQEAGKIALHVAEYDGTLTPGLTLDGDTDADGEIDVTIGAGVDSKTTLAGGLVVEGVSGSIINNSGTPGNTFTGYLGYWSPTTDWNTGSQTSYGQKIWLDQNRNTASGATNTFIGTQIVIDDDGTHVGTIDYTGIDMSIDFVNTDGTQKAKGIEMNITDCDTTDLYGLDLKIEDGGTDIRLKSSADTGDYFSIATTTHGATTISTVDDDATAADLTFDIHGEIVLDAHTGEDIFFKENGTERIQWHLDATPTMEVTGNFDLDLSGTLDIDADGGTIQFKDDGVKMATFTTEGFRGDRKFAITGATHFEHSGDVLYFGSGSTTQGDLCYLKEDGSWGQADADGAATGDDADRDAMGMLAIALGTDPDVDGMFVKGVITMDYDLGDVGNPLYVSNVAGAMATAAPTGSGDFVRVVGYCLDDTDGQMWFSPDNTWVERS